MRQEIIDKLKCSSCSSTYHVAFISPVAHRGNNNNEITYGTVKCCCGEFPLVDGILVTRKYANLPKVVDTVKKARSRYSLEKTALLLIEEPYVRFMFRLSLIIKRIFGKWPWLSFWKITTFIQNSRYATYLKFRFSCPSFISAMALIPVFKDALSDGGLLLDLGSGVGHFDFLLSRYFGGERLVCAEKHFMNLYFARNYIVGGGASFICLDADEKIPFKDRIFSAILSMDAFHYIEKKQSLADEFKRALKDGGVLFLLHLHNKNVENVAKGLPLAPEEYAGLFPGYNARFFPERFLVENVFGGAALDVARDSDIDAVNASDAVSIVLSKGTAFLKKYEHFSAVKPVSQLQNIILNPLYMKVGKQYLRRFPSDYYENEYYLIEEYFPEKVDAALPQDELKRHLVFIPVPENFKKEGERLYRFRLWR